MNLDNKLIQVTSYFLWLYLNLLMTLLQEYCMSMSFVTKSGGVIQLMPIDL